MLPRVWRLVLPRRRGANIRTRWHPGALSETLRPSEQATLNRWKATKTGMHVLSSIPTPSLVLRLLRRLPWIHKVWAAPRGRRSKADRLLTLTPGWLALASASVRLLLLVLWLTKSACAPSLS